jgi:hypothetical protein
LLAQSELIATPGTPFASLSTPITITLTIQEKCLLAPSTTPLLPSSYQIDDPDLTVTFAAFQHPSYCTPIVYTVALADGSPIPSCVTFLPAAKSLKVFSIDKGDAGDFDIRVTGTSATASAFIIWKVSIQYKPIVLPDLKIPPRFA